jgi:DNA modification methylase
MLNIHHGHCITELRKLAAQGLRVHCCVTSPPYWGLRDYKTPPVDWEEVTFAPMPGLPALNIPAWTGHLGLEPDPLAFVGHIVAVFREVKNVLRHDGTLWLNFGDSYANDCFGTEYLKRKDLTGMPWRIAFALQADGWYLRTDIIWHKPTVMPESVTDRPTKAHEYLFLLTLSPEYFYDAEAIKEGASLQTHARSSAANQFPSSLLRDDENGRRRKLNGSGVGFGHGYDANPKPRVKGRVAGVNPKSEEDAFNSKQNSSFSAAVAQVVETRNKRTVWTIPSEPYSEAHFATFPTGLVRPCILAGTSAHGCCSECGAPWERALEKVAEGKRKRVDRGQPSGKPMASNGREWKPVEYRDTGWQPTCTCQGATLARCSVLDPFLGSGTTAQVAIELNREAHGIELGEHHLPLIHKRTNVTPGLPLS